MYNNTQCIDNPASTVRIMSSLYVHKPIRHLHCSYQSIYMAIIIMHDALTEACKYYDTAALD